MALMETIRNLTNRDAADQRRVNEELRRLYAGFFERADRLEASAALAPSEATESDLKRLAADHRKAAEHLQTALVARDSSVPAVHPSNPQPTGHNHWARIVEDLEALQHGRDDIQQVSDAFLERNPDLERTFGALTRIIDDHVTRLRGEIARADPLALN